MKTWVQWLAWFIDYVILGFLTVVIVTFLLCYPVKMDNVVVDGVTSFFAHYRNVIGDVEPTVVFVFFADVLLSLISFSILVSCFFTRGESAACHNFNRSVCRSVNIFWCSNRDIWRWYIEK